VNLQPEPRPPLAPEARPPLTPSPAAPAGPRGGARASAVAHQKDKIANLSRRDLTATVQQARLVRKTAQRKYLAGLRVSRARQALAELPPPGHTLHAIIRGNFDFWDVIPATLQLAGARCEQLLLASLSVNRKHLEAMLELIDQGQIERVRLVLSTFFETHERGLCDWITEQLQARGAGAVAIVRNHAKVFCLALDDGRRYVIEGSANLRSCRNVEQFIMAEDEQLHDFHAQWIDEVCKNDKPT
jgi:hypothetical protein